MLPYISYVAIADGKSALDKTWQEFVSGRKKCIPEANWLILVGDVHYEIVKDKKLIMAKDYKEVLNTLVKLYFNP